MTTPGDGPRATTDPLEWLRARAAERTASGLRRRLRARESGEEVVDLASNDYLGLARHPEVVEAAAAAAKEWGAGSTGSRLVTGTTGLHAELDAALARFSGAQAALVFSSGYLANLGAVTALSGPGTLVVSDAHNHASIVDACRLSRARVVVTPHLDVAAVEAALAARAEERALVVTDAVFSVEGERAPLEALHDVVRRHAALLVVDEAHSLGVLGPGGRGLVHGCGFAGEPDVVVTATLSKAFAAQGGVVLGRQEVVDHLVDAARPFIFDTGLAPAAAGAALAALRLVEAQPALPGYALAAAQRLAAAADSAGLPAVPPQAAVVGVRIGAPERALALAERLLAAGVRVGCFRPPSVPDGVSRLRLTAHPLPDAVLDHVAAALRAATGPSDTVTAGMP